MTDRKPCPFCGESKTEMIIKDVLRKRIAYVRCKNCFAEGPLKAVNPARLSPRGNGPLAECASMAWNCRDGKVSRND